MQFASPRLLDLSLFGNAGHLRDAEACDRLSGFPWELGVGTQSLAAVFNKTNNLLSRRRLKGHCQQRLDRYRSPVHGVGLELPLLHAVDRGSRKSQRSLQELCVLHGAVAAN